MSKIPTGPACRQAGYHGFLKNPHNDRVLSFVAGLVDDSLKNGQGSKVNWFDTFGV